MRRGAEAERTHACLPLLRFCARKPFTADLMPEERDTDRYTDIDRVPSHTLGRGKREMTSAGVVPAGPFPGTRTTRAPRDAGGPPFVLSVRAEPRIKGGELQ